MALVSHETQPPSAFAPLLGASPAQASLRLCVTFCPQILSSLFSLGKEQVPALTSCYVSGRDLPHVHRHTRERLCPSTNKAGGSGGWVTLLPSHLCTLASSVTTESFPFHSTCAMDMPSCLEECLLVYRTQNCRWGLRNDSHWGFLCSLVPL